MLSIEFISRMISCLILFYLFILKQFTLQFNVGKEKTDTQIEPGTP
jgi:hypothetical protein